MRLYPVMMTLHFFNDFRQWRWIDMESDNYAIIAGLKSNPTC